MIGDGGEMGALGARQAADETDEAVKMTLLMATRMRLIELHEALLYGTIAAVRVTHCAPPD